MGDSYGLSLWSYAAVSGRAVMMAKHWFGAFCKDAFGLTWSERLTNRPDYVSPIWLPRIGMMATEPKFRRHWINHCMIITDHNWYWQACRVHYFQAHCISLPYYGCWRWKSKKTRSKCTVLTRITSGQFGSRAFCACAWRIAHVTPRQVTRTRVRRKNNLCSTCPPSRIFENVL